MSNCPRCQIVLLAWLVSNCPRCQIVRGVKLSHHHYFGFKFCPVMVLNFENPCNKSVDEPCSANSESGCDIMHNWLPLPLSIHKTFCYGKTSNNILFQNFNHGRYLWEAMLLLESILCFIKKVGFQHT